MVGKPIRVAVWQLRAEQAQCVSVLVLHRGQEPNEIRQPKSIIHTVMIVGEAEFMFKCFLADGGGGNQYVFF